MRELRPGKQPWTAEPQRKNALAPISPLEEEDCIPPPCKLITHDGNVALIKARGAAKAINEDAKQIRLEEKTRKEAKLAEQYRIDCARVLPGLQDGSIQPSSLKVVELKAVLFTRRGVKPSGSKDVLVASVRMKLNLRPVHAAPLPAQTGERKHA